MFVASKKISFGVWLCLLILCLTVVQGKAQGVKNSILQAKTEFVKVKLLSPEGNAIAGSKVELHSDNGIRCIKAPCPTNGKKWSGKTNGKGFVSIPTNVIQKATTIWTTDYPNGTDFIAQAIKDKNKVWAIKLRKN